VASSARFGAQLALVMLYGSYRPLKACAGRRQMRLVSLIQP